MKRIRCTSCVYHHTLYCRIHHPDQHGYICSDYIAKSVVERLYDIDSGTQTLLEGLDAE